MEMMVLNLCAYGDEFFSLRWLFHLSFNTIVDSNKSSYIYMIALNVHIAAAR